MPWHVCWTRLLDTSVGHVCEALDDCIKLSILIVSSPKRLIGFLVIIVVVFVVFVLSFVFSVIARRAT